MLGFFLKQFKILSSIFKDYVKNCDYFNLTALFCLMTHLPLLIRSSIHLSVLGHLFTSIRAMSRGGLSPPEVIGRMWQDTPCTGWLSITRSCEVSEEELIIDYAVPFTGTADNIFLSIGQPLTLSNDGVFGQFGFKFKFNLILPVKSHQ